MDMPANRAKSQQSSALKLQFPQRGISLIELIMFIVSVTLAGLLLVMCTVGGLRRLGSVLGLRSGIALRYLAMESRTMDFALRKLYFGPLCGGAA